MYVFTYICMYVYMYTYTHVCLYIPYMVCQYISVVTPPLKNVRKRRFRKTARKNKLLESPEVEKEVKRLIREDLAAIKVGIFLIPCQSI